jgi:hypothetical protein
MLMCMCMTLRWAIVIVWNWYEWIVIGMLYWLEEGGYSTCDEIVMTLNITFLSDNVVVIFVVDVV